MPAATRCAPHRLAWLLALTLALPAGAAGPEASTSAPACLPSPLSSWTLRPAFKDPVPPTTLQRADSDSDGGHRSDAERAAPMHGFVNAPADGSERSMHSRRSRFPRRTRRSSPAHQHGCRLVSIPRRPSEPVAVTLPAPAVAIGASCGLPQNDFLQDLRPTNISLSPGFYLRPVSTLA